MKGPPEKTATACRNQLLGGMTPAKHSNSTTWDKDQGWKMDARNIKAMARLTRPNYR